MRWMRGWGPEDLASASPEQVSEIMAMMIEEAEEAERNSHRG